MDRNILTTVDLVADNARLYPETPFLNYYDEIVTYKDLSERTDAFAACDSRWCSRICCFKHNTVKSYGIGVWCDEWYHSRFLGPLSFGESQDSPDY